MKPERSGGQKNDWKTNEMRAFGSFLATDGRNDSSMEPEIMKLETNWITDPLTNEVALFADGSFSSQAQFGAWAFYVPKVGVAGSGTCSGRSSQRFELMAIARGLAAIAARDMQQSPVRIVSDCTYAIRWILKLRKFGREWERAVQPSCDDRDLIDEISSVVQTRRVSVVRNKQGSPDHRRCHGEALIRLRTAIRDDPTLVHIAEIARHRTRLGQLTEAREILRADLAKMEEEMMAEQSQLDSLSTLINSGTR